MDAPREERQLVRIIEEVSRQLLAMKIREFQRVDSLDLSMNHFHYIDTIHQMEAPTFSELASRLKISKPAVTAIVDKLIKLGIVTKEQSHEDRRVYRIRLKPKGKKLALAYQKALLDFAGEVRNRLEEGEYIQLIRLLEKVVL